MHFFDHYYVFMRRKFVICLLCNVMFVNKCHLSRNCYIIYFNLCTVNALGPCDRTQQIYSSSIHPTKAWLTEPAPYIEPVLIQCWFTVCDADPDITPHWLNELCFAGQSHTQQTRGNVGLMLGQRRSWWANIEPALVKCLVLAGYLSPCRPT